MIDCDLYESARTALDSMIPYVEDGCIILFDEWYAYRGIGAHGKSFVLSETGTGPKTA